MGKTVLIVEDDNNIAELLRLYLEKEGYVTLVASDGGAGLEQFRQHHPDIVLLDVMMPVMDGFEASRAIRALDRPDAATVPILAMTAQASDECAQSCHQVGMNGRLVKPLDAKKLAKSIWEAVQNKQ